MKKILGLGLALFLVIAGIVVFLSMKKVPDGAGRWLVQEADYVKLSPGFHFLAPWARTVSLEGMEFTLNSRGTLYSCEYAAIPYAAEGKGKYAVACLRDLPGGHRLPKTGPDEALALAVYEAGLSCCLERLADPAVEKEEMEGRLKHLLRRQGIEGISLTFQWDEKKAREALRAKQPIEARLQSPLPVLFIGLDAADWMILDRLTARGRLPAFAALKARGAWGNILSEEPMLSPILWTTIATGKHPGKHGILEFTERDAASGKDLPVTSDKRRVKALWNILSEHGRTLGILGWWATYPAEWVNGILVSERIGYQLFGMTGKFKDQPGLISPFARPPITPHVTTPEAVPFEEVRPFLHVSEREFNEAWDRGRKADNLFEDPVNHLRAILASTRTLKDITLDLLRAQPWDLMAPYFEGPDTVGHRFAQYLPPRLDRVPPQDFEKYRDAMDQYYIHMDGVIADLVRAFPERGYVMIASDHGFKTGASRPRENPEDMVLGAPQWHRKFGVFLLAGPGVAAGELSPVSILDIAPTLLYLQGLPIPGDMDGRLVREAFKPGFLAQHPPQRVETYETPSGRPMPPARQAVQGADERLKELQALGYIGHADTPAPASPSGGKEVESYTAWYNLGNDARFRGDAARAKQCFQKAVEANASFGLAMFNLASLLAAEGDHTGAYTWLAKALEVGNAVPSLAAVHLVDEARLTGRVEEAYSHLGTLEGKYGTSPTYYSALGIALVYRNKAEPAHEMFLKALALDPYEVYALEEDLKLAARFGWSTPAEAGLKAALKDGGIPSNTLKDLGKACLRLGLVPEALVFLKRALADDDSDPELLLFTASALHQSGEKSQAEKMFARALAIDPHNARILFNYGALLANTGRLSEAYARLQEAQRCGMRSPDLFNALGRVTFRLGKRDEAAGYLKTSLEMDPAQPDIREMAKELGVPLP
jgi:predicted AlkP superfamily phosphohydrolase/phosphomutase/Tfp pilus assembly protein PilF